MTRDETARRLRKALNKHAQKVTPSPHALFSINRRIKDSNDSREFAWPAVLKRVKPSFVIGAVAILFIGLFAGTLFTNNSPGEQIQLTSPDVSQDPDSNQVSTDTATVDSSDLTGLEDTPAHLENLNSCDNANTQSGNINVYFVCDNSLVARQRSTSEPSLKNALLFLVAGPTQAEIQNGFSSTLVDARGNLIKSVEVQNGWAVIDFTSDFPVSVNALDQLNSTVFDFPEIHLVEYRIEDSCSAFSMLNDKETCFSYTKSQARRGGGDRRVVPLKQAQVGPRNIYSCASSSVCDFLGTLETEDVDPSRIYRYTGGQLENQEGKWLEVITPDNKLGWVGGKGVSVQLSDKTSQQDFYPIINSLANLPEDNSSISAEAFSGAGIHGSYVSTAPYGYFYISDPHNPNPVELINLNRILEAVKNTSPAELIEASPLLQNIEYTSVESDSYKMNLYFDYRNGEPEIIAISIHYGA